LPDVARNVRLALGRGGVGGGSELFAERGLAGESRALGLQDRGDQVLAARCAHEGTHRGKAGSLGGGVSLQGSVGLDLLLELEGGGLKLGLRGGREVLF
jgi:hypothetical protein